MSDVALDNRPPIGLIGRPRRLIRTTWPVRNSAPGPGQEPRGLRHVFGSAPAGERRLSEDAILPGVRRLLTPSLS